jgi:hypothetical protein
MSGVDAVIVAASPQFRLVRQTSGDRVTYVLEVPEKPDALGCERWREVTVENKNPLTFLRDFIIRHSLTCPNCIEQKETHEPQ